MKTSPKLLQALCNLRASSDFRTFMEALKEDEIEQVKRCIDGRDEVLLNAQGAAKVLIGIRETFENAPTALDRIKPT